MLHTMSTSHKHMSQIYTQDYFENGINSGLSLYENYRWLPHSTIPMAASIAQKLGFNSTTTVLDYGCAMGYLVKAFRYLGFEASGFDISDYAISNLTKKSNHFYSQKRKSSMKMLTIGSYPKMSSNMFLTKK